MTKKIEVVRIWARKGEMTVKKILVIILAILGGSGYLFFSTNKNNSFIHKTVENPEIKNIGSNKAKIDEPNIKSDEEPKIKDETVQNEKVNSSETIVTKEENQQTPSINTSENNTSNVPTPSITPNVDTPSPSDIPQNPKPREPQVSTQPTIWEELGISEYDYYNSPMLSWQKVTHQTFEECKVAGNLATEIKVNPETGEFYQEYSDYWCYQVNSYSGKSLGVMLKLS